MTRERRFEEFDDEPAKREGQIETQMDALEIGLKHLEERIQEVSRRLAPISRPPSENKPVAERNPVGPPELVPLAARLRDKARKLDDLSSDIASIIRQLEL